MMGNNPTLTLELAAKGALAHRCGGVEIGAVFSSHCPEPPECPAWGHHTRRGLPGNRGASSPAVPPRRRPGSHPPASSAEYSRCSGRARRAVLLGRGDVDAIVEPDVASAAVACSRGRRDRRALAAPVASARSPASKADKRRWATSPRAWQTPRPWPDHIGACGMRPAAALTGLSPAQA
jgi:hypothetical protein